jgi:hypothetical protein
MKQVRQSFGEIAYRNHEKSLQGLTNLTVFSHCRVSSRLQPGTYFVNQEPRNEKDLLIGNWLFSNARSMVSPCGDDNRLRLEGEKYSNALCDFGGGEFTSAHGQWYFRQSKYQDGLFSSDVSSCSVSRFIHTLWHAGSAFLYFRMALIRQLSRASPYISTHHLCGRCGDDGSA